MNHAVFCVTPRSRCSFIDETPFKLVTSRYTAISHFLSGTWDFAIAVPVFTEKYFPQSRQR